MRPPLGAAALTAMAILAGCAGTSDRQDARPAPTGSPRPAEATPTPAPSTPVQVAGRTRPGWLGKRALPLRSDGYGQIRSTPKVLRNRRLPTIDLLPPPEKNPFSATVRKVPRSVAARSTWKPGCPVSLGELRYLRVSFWGFDDLRHTGELLVHRSAARDLVGVFRRLYQARWPIEEMRVVEEHELDAPPTGDGNNTTAFVCRPTRGATSFSEHASGLAIDINPFHNPYVKGDVVLPELASAYKNRGWKRPGMIFKGDPVVAGFDRIGWTWGGRWRSLVDPMHFSATGK